MIPTIKAFYHSFMDVQIAHSIDYTGSSNKLVRWNHLRENKRDAPMVYGYALDVYVKYEITYMFIKSGNSKRYPLLN